MKVSDTLLNETIPQLFFYIKYFVNFKEYLLLIHLENAESVLLSVQRVHESLLWPACICICINMYLYLSLELFSYLYYLFGFLYDCICINQYTCICICLNIWILAPGHWSPQPSSPVLGRNSDKSQTLGRNSLEI